jgi:hypothetical protein
MKDLGQALVVAGRVIEIADPEIGGSGKISGDFDISS